MYWTLGEAAKETGRSKSQLHRAIKSGKMSFVEKTTDGYKLDPAEVYRAFPKVEQVNRDDLEQSDTPRDTIGTQLYEQKIEFLERQIAAMQGQLETQTEATQNHIEEKKRLLLLLEKQGLMLEHLSKKEALTEEEKPQKRGLFSWFKW
jgi:hypothetical protein